MAFHRADRLAVEARRRNDAGRGGCTAGFLNESQVLLERLARKPVTRADLEKTIADALDGHLCRCTGYIKYHEAVRDVILADPARYLAT
jgi:aerobic-type carbon monoxide dehydrogenase small subunit (CoxS/CutS family)